MVLGLTLRETASLIDICKITTDNWRHKVMEAMKHFDKESPLEGEIQMDETYFLLNIKGHRHLPRPSKKRKTRRYFRGLSTEYIAVLTAIDENDRILIEPVGQGNPSAGKLMNALDGRITPKSTLITYSTSAYEQVAEYYNATLHQIPADALQKGV